MRLSHIAAILITAASLNQAVRADAIPAPVDISPEQRALIGVWVQEKCVLPNGLGHSCMSRVFAFGNESFSEIMTTELSMANEWGNTARTGKWSATSDGTTFKVTVTYADKAEEMVIVLGAGDKAFDLVSEEGDRYPATRFLRQGEMITPN